MPKAFTIEITNLFIDSSGETLLKNINLTLKKGTCLGLTGKDEAGKTSLLKFMAGYIPYVNTSQFSIVGSYSFYGIKEEKSNQDAFFELLSNEVSLITNDISDNFIGLKIKQEVGCLSTETAYYTKILETFDLLSFLDRDIHTLSGGERIRFLLACSYIKNSSVLLFDDITTQLDSEARVILKSEIKKLKLQGKSLIISDNNVDYFKDVIDETIFLEDGEISSIKNNFRNDVKLLSGLNISEPIIKVEGLNIAINRKTLIIDVNLTLYGTDLVFITGKNGSGKTTFADTLLNLRKHQKGNIWIKEGVRIGYIFQNSDLQTIEEEVGAELFLEPFKKRLSIHEKNEYLNWSLNFIDCNANESTLHLHPAKHRLLQIATTAKCYDLIILDEPTINMDSENKNKVIEYISNGRKEGMSFIIITHDEYILSSVNKNIYEISDYKMLKRN